MSPSDISAECDPDAALMLRVKEGDTDAFVELVDKYKQPVMNLVYRMLRDATEAEDLARRLIDRRGRKFSFAPR